jgi:cyclophilin family peptidyl-prolyl cis-trans isomerase
MALSGPDTGGSQWFVTHSPQPHLDGTYTVFGRVVRGMDAAGRILPGDRIIRVEEVR